MALANFFNKTALAGSQVLRGFDREAFAAALQGFVPGLSFDGAAVRSPDSRITLEMTVNLLSRLYPRLSIRALDSEAERDSAWLATVAREINPAIEICELPAALELCVGATATRDRPTLYVGNRGWELLTSTGEPVGTHEGRNPFAAAAAACVAVSNIFRRCFTAQLSRPELDGNLCLSILDLVPNRKGAGPTPLAGDFDVGDLHVVGLGAIGQGLAWTLGRVLGARGSVTLVDSEVVELSNLQRYVLARQASLGKPKVELAASALRAAGFTVSAQPYRWGEYLGARGDWHLDRVAVAVDSAEARCDVQAALPRRILNAWTRAENLGVSRHGFGDGGPCLMCLYLPRKPIDGDDVRVRTALRLGPEHGDTIKALLALDLPLDEQFLGLVTAALGVETGSLSAFQGKPLRRLYSDGVCGGILLSLGVGQERTEQRGCPARLPVSAGGSSACGRGGSRLSGCGARRHAGDNHGRPSSTSRRRVHVSPPARSLSALHLRR